MISIMIAFVKISAAMLTKTSSSYVDFLRERHAKKPPSWNPFHEMRSLKVETAPLKFIQLVARMTAFVAEKQ